MKAIKLLFLVIAVSSSAFGQASLRSLSRPEKCWAFFHPFKAIKARSVTKHVLAVVDSVGKSGSIGTDGNGGKLDAFRHCYWMINLSLEIGDRQARKLGKAHEKGNYLQFKKGQLEENALPDSVSSEMDLRNNAVGIHLVRYGHFTNAYGGNAIEETMKLLANGELFIIKKDKAGNCLECSGTIIDKTVWKGKWNIPKCLIASKE